METFEESFKRHYLVTALWSSHDDDGEPLDRNYGIEDIDPSTKERLGVECDNFIGQAGSVLTGAIDAYWPHRRGWEKAGHDFWLTRNGHGAGFWDGDWNGEDGDYGDKLTEISRDFGEVDLYIGDDGMIYASP